MTPPGELVASPSAPAAPFFVIGSARSGTTMFRLMLNAHSRLHVPRESWFLTNLLDELPAVSPLSEEQVERALEIMTSHSRWRDFQVAEPDARAAVGALRSPLLRDVVDTIYRLPSDKPRWGDKTPGYVTEIARLSDLFPDAQFIHVVRDCRDVCHSLYRLGWHGKTMRKIGDYWRVSVSKAREDGDRLGPGRYLEVHYEDLVLHTRATLERATAFIGERFEDAMLSFHRNAGEHIAPWAGVIHGNTTRAPRPSDVERWRRELSALQIAVIETVAGSTMVAFGQRRYFAGGARAVPLGLAAAFALADWSLPARRRLHLHFPAAYRRL